MKRKFLIETHRQQGMGRIRAFRDFPERFFYGSFIYAPSDDAYIFYVYAKNFVKGNGLTFNGE